MTALHREHSLHNELTELRSLYNEAVSNNERLQQQNIDLQNDWNRSRDRLSLDCEHRVKDLTEQLFILKNRLELTEKERDKAADLRGRQTSVSLCLLYCPKGAFPLYQNNRVETGMHAN